MKIVLVRPMGGLNDLLCQVGRGLVQAKLRNRALTIDLTFNDRFPAKFSDFFMITGRRGSRVFTYSKLTLEEYAKSVHPTDLEGRLFDRNAWQVSNWIVETRLSGQPITWPLGVSRKKLIIHQQWGGGVLSLLALNLFSPSKWLTETASRAKHKYPGSSDLNLHFRNTDYKSDSELLMRIIQSNSGRKIRIYSDGPAPFQNNRDGVSWSYKALSSSPEDNLTVAILDVVSMSNAVDFQPVPISHPQIPYSGYGLLARALWVFRASSTLGFVSRLVVSMPYFGGSNLRARIRFWTWIVPFFSWIWISAKFGRGTLGEWLDLC